MQMTLKMVGCGGEWKLGKLMAIKHYINNFAYKVAPQCKKNVCPLMLVDNGREAVLNVRDER